MALDHTDSTSCTDSTAHAGASDPSHSTVRSRQVRRVRCVIAAGAASLLLLAACSSGEADRPEATGSGEFPITVEHAYGTTTIDSEPKRIVSVGVTEQDALWALGADPVGVTEWYGEYPHASWPWADEARGDSEPTVLEATDGPDLEAVAELEPDLIIGVNAGLTKSQYQQLSELAPTVAHSADYPMYFEPWEVQLEQIGEALGKSDEAKGIADDIDDQFAEAAEEHPELADVPVVYLQNQISEGNAIAYQNGLGTDFLTQLGPVVPSEIDEYAPEDASGGQAYIPEEKLDVLNAADVLIWGTEERQDRAALEKNPVVKRLEPMQAKKVVYTDDVLAGAIYFSTPLSLPYVIDNLTPALAEAAAGKGPVQVGSD